MFNLAIKRIFRSGVQNFKRQGNLSFVTVSILVITICLITLLFISHGILDIAISEIREKADVSVYFQQNCSEKEIFELKEKLAELPEVKLIEYISEDEALERFIEKHKEEKALMNSLQELGSNPFLASLNITASEVSSYEKVADFLENENYAALIEKVDFYKRRPIIERIFKITFFVDNAGILIALVLILASILVTYNTVKLTIYTQKEEISICRLVGASNWFIRGPFLVQAAICGILSFLTAFLIVSFSSYFLGPKIAAFFPEIELLSFFKGNFQSIVLLQLICSSGLGVVPSFLAIRKYLEV